MNTERAMTEERLLAPLGLTLEQSTWEFGRAAGHVSASDQVISFDHLSRGPTRRPSTCSGAPYPGVTGTWPVVVSVSPCSGRAVPPA